MFCTPFGKTIRTNFTRCWNKARRRAGLATFRFHDLQYPFASRLARKGVDSYQVQQAGGWRTPSMMQRYTHLDPDTIRAAVSFLDGNGHQQPVEPAEGRSEALATA